LLSPSQLTAIHALSTRDRQQRYLELAIKIANLVVLDPAELQELVILRDLLVNHAENMRLFGSGDAWNDGVES
jgi:hypothetical protein